MKSPPSGKPELRQEPVWDNEDDEDSVSVAPDDLTDRLKELGDIVEEKRAEKKVLLPQSRLHLSLVRATKPHP